MKLSTLILSAGMALGAMSCGGTTPPGQGGNASLGTGAQNAAPVANAGASAEQPGGQPADAAKAATGNRTEGDVPPKDAHFTIFCDVFRGPEHVLRASQAKEDLIRATGLRSWHIIHTDDQSSLFFGYYRTFDDKAKDPAEVVRAQADKKLLADLKDSSGLPRFTSSLFVPIDEPDPEAPARWNLANAPADAFWSLQICAYRGSPERKLDAVESVRELRKKGFEAYYYHGETISSVCIGAWPRDAVKEQDQDHVKTPSDTDIPLVLNAPLPNNVIPEMRDKQGHQLTVIAPKLVVLSKTMAQAIRDFPNHAINGMWYAKVGKNGQQFIDPSFLVILPHREEMQTPTPEVQAAQDSTPGAAAGNTAAGNIVDNPTPPTPGYTRLRSIGQ